MSHNQINHFLVCLPVARKTSQVGHDEVHIAVLRSAHFPRWHSFKAMNLNTAKPPAHGLLHHLEDPARIAASVNKGKPDQAWPISLHDCSQLPISDGIVAVENRENYGSIDSGSSRSSQIGSEVTDRVPGSSNLVAFSSMTMTVDDHEPSPMSA